MQGSVCLAPAPPLASAIKSTTQDPLPGQLKDAIANIFATQEEQVQSFFIRLHEEQRQRVESAIADFSHVVQGGADSLESEGKNRQTNKVVAISTTPLDSSVSLEKEDGDEQAQYNSGGAQSFEHEDSFSAEQVKRKAIILRSFSGQGNNTFSKESGETPSLFGRYIRAIRSLRGQPNQKERRCGCWQSIRAHGLKALVDHPVFESFTAGVIVVNALSIAYASDYAMKNLDNQVTAELKVVEGVFCVIYTLEFILRLNAVGCRSYLCGEGYKWNRFDMSLVLITLYDQLAEAITIPSANLSFLRIMRLLKMMRLLRMIRLMRMFRELRLILAAIFGCVQSMIWSCLLMFMVAFIFGICFLQACTVYLTEGQDKHADAIHKYWGSVFVSMLSLYMAGTGGKEWIALSDPLWDVGAMYYFLFLLYVAFFLFVVMNTLTSLVVEATRENSEKDIQGSIQEELKRKHFYMQKLATLFNKIDASSAGEITYNDFMIAMVESRELLAFAQSLEIETCDLDQFFKVLSAGGTRAVDLETFVVGCIKLKGTARSTDLIDLIQMHKRATQNLTQICETNARLAQNADHGVGRLREEIKYRSTDIAAI